MTIAYDHGGIDYRHRPVLELIDTLLPSGTCIQEAVDVKLASGETVYDLVMSPGEVKVQIFASAVEKLVRWAELTALTKHIAEAHGRTPA